MKALIVLKNYSPGQSVLKDIDWQKNCLIDAGYEVEICADGSSDAARLAEKIKKLEALKDSLLLLNYTEKWERGCVLLAGSRCKKAVRFFGEYCGQGEGVSVAGLAEEAARARSGAVFCDSGRSLDACLAAGIERSRLFLLPVNYNAEYYDGIKADMQFLHRLIDGKINVLVETGSARPEYMEFVLSAAKKYVKFFEKNLRLLVIENGAGEELSGTGEKNHVEAYDLSGKTARIGRPNLSRRKALFLASHILLVPSACWAMTAQILESQYFKVPVLLFGKGSGAGKGVYDCGDCSSEELAAGIYTFFHNLDARMELAGKGTEEYREYVSADRASGFSAQISRLQWNA